MKTDMTVGEARKVLDDYPSYYDAHRDRLAESYDHQSAVNELLRAARALLKALDAK